MKTDIKFRSKRPVPVILLIAAAATGFYLSLPISGLGGKEDFVGITPVSDDTPIGSSTEKDIQLLKDQLDTERQEYSKIEKRLLEEKGYSQDLLLAVRRYREIAGMTDVIGPGIILTLSESKSSGFPDENPGQFLIHQQDLLNIINELWHNDADAVAVGSPGGGTMERITTFTPVRCSGGAIIVNDTRMVPPFEIRAIGEPGLLKTVLEIRGGYLDDLKLINIDSIVETSDRVFIPKYNGITLWLHARSILGGVDENIIPDEVAGEGGGE